MKVEFFFGSFLKKNSGLPNFMKIRPVRAELFHGEGRTGGRTDRHGDVNSRFPKNFLEKKKVLKNCFFYSVSSSFPPAVRPTSDHNNNKSNIISGVCDADN